MLSAMSRNELVAELLKLDPEERMRAAEELWQSVSGEAFELSAGEMKEIERRMEDHERDPSSAIPWDVVRARLLAKFG